LYLEAVKQKPSVGGDKEIKIEAYIIIATGLPGNI